MASAEPIFELDKHASPEELRAVESCLALTISEMVQGRLYGGPPAAHHFLGALRAEGLTVKRVEQ